MPSKPLLGMPVVVGMSDAVMAMRSTFSCAEAGDSDEQRGGQQQRRRTYDVFMQGLRSGAAHARSGPSLRHERLDTHSRSNRAR